MNGWNKLTGRDVNVSASGISYTGTLIEINELAVILRAPTGYREVPLEKVVSIELSRGLNSLPPSPLRR
ncbi:MAG: hypothetical protein C0609_08425 [Deltaproteobacteria bacterium]|nr:MAG: hypothetical protein C0609_08425 [Deltaproteobacteria bacterium]